MSRNARVEEVSDSDPDDMDPSDFDPGNAIITPANVPTSASAADAMRRASPAAAAPSAFAQFGGPNPMSVPLPQPMSQQQIPKHYHCLYPVYFDKTRSRAQGRMVGSKLAVENPLAREIVDAVQALGLRCGFEPEKLHPKDWANPGRVRVMLKDEDGRRVSSVVKNKHDLYIKVATYLKAHPTTEETPFRLRIKGLPVPEKPLPPTPAPRGWKIGTVLPIHSPGVTGGGVSDNPFKDAMKEMQEMGGLPGMGGMPGLPGMPGMPGMPPGMGMPGMGMPDMGGPSGSGAESKKKKDKKKR